MDLDADRHRSSTTADLPPDFMKAMAESGVPATPANLKREAGSTRSDTP